MFTGLITQVGSLVRMRRHGDERQLTVSHASWDAPLTVGESVAVQGVCLTVTAVRDGEFDCNVLDETVEKTSLAAKKTGAALNLERALRPADWLGGHIVNGHVDATGTVTSIGRQGLDWVIEVSCAADLLPQLAPKGSVAVDGVSLTVVRVTAHTFSVHIIPHTWKHTSLAALHTGDPVNVETDVLAKYVARYIEARGSRTAGGLTLETLARAGFPLS